MTPEEKKEDLKKRVEEVMSFIKSKDIEISARLAKNDSSLQAILYFKDIKEVEEEKTKE